MSVLGKRAEIFSELQKEILALEGFKSAGNTVLDVGLGPIRHSFPNSAFPVGAVHEFLSTSVETNAATTGFISGLLSTLMGKKGTTMWISASRTLFPPALKNFGIQPDRFVFIDLKKESDVLWAMNEALKCGALSAVVGELREIDFTASRRLQLAVEESQVTGFVLRNNSKPPGTTACVSRWQITPLPSETVDELPGIGFPRWKVELLRIRNGKPGSWDVMWKKGRFHPVEKKEVAMVQHKKTG